MQMRVYFVQQDCHPPDILNLLAIANLGKLNQELNKPFLDVLPD